MTPEQQRIKIAEACGFTPCDTGDICWLHPKTSFHHTLTGGGGTMVLPDYLSDLNAASEFCKVLFLRGYACRVFHSETADRNWEVTLSIDGSRNTPIEGPNLAEVISQAGLRALNLWDDSK